MDVKRPDSNELVEKHSDPSTKYREEIDEIAESDSSVPVPPEVKLLALLFIFIMVGLVAYIRYSFSETDTQHEIMEENIKSGSQEKTLKALNAQKVQSVSIIYNLVIIFIVLFASIVIGFLWFYQGASQHKDRKKNQLAKVAKNAVAQQGQVIAVLSERQRAQMENIEKLQNDIKEYERKIDEQRKKDEKNVEEIKKLEKEKQEKAEELAKAREKLASTKAHLEDAEKRENELRDNVKKKEESERNLQQKLDDNRADLARTQADLSREKSQTSSLQTALRKEESQSQSLRDSLRRERSDAANLRDEMRRDYENRIERLERRKPTTRRTFFFL